jgi:radical SAM protein (TIGR01212 family)
MPEKPVTQQINEGIAFHGTRYRRAVKYIAYFQAYSNTYAPIEHLKKIYAEALAHPGVSGISIGTRPDCINDEILDLLQALSQQCHTGVEYGLESCNDSILQAVRRGHTWADSESAIRKTAARNIHVGVHLLLGLPGESRKSMLEAAGIISRLPVNSLKVHQLQILKGTAMEQQYRESPEAFHLFSLEEYIDFVIDFLEVLSPYILIERLTAEAPPRYLAAPDWGLVRNDRVLQLIEARMEVRNTWQGRKYKP